MSGFRTNLSDTLAAARLRATRSGDTIRSLLSPTVASASVGDMSAGPRPPGVSFATLGRQMAGLSTAASSSGQGEVEGGSGEFSLRVGGSKDLSIFVLDDVSCTHLCLGAVNGGIKFCLFPAEKCSVGAHSKKVDVHLNHVYVNAGRNAAYTDPHVPKEAVGTALTSLLGELHPREEWLLLFQDCLDSMEGASGAIKSLSTPRKRKFRYLSDPTDLAVGESPLSSFSSWEMDDQSEPLKALATAFRKFETRFTDFQLSVGEDVDVLFNKFQDLKASVGTQPQAFNIGGLSGECVTIWEAFQLFSSVVLDPERFSSLDSSVRQLTTLNAQHSTTLKTLETSYTEMSDLLQLLSTEQGQLVQLVSLAGTSTGGTPSFRQEIQVLQDRLLILEDAISAGSHNSELATLKAQLKLIEARLPSDPFVIGGRSFNSKADVALFVEKELTGLSFSLFHDAITLLESITDGQSKKTEVMAAMYQASRVGFDEDEATHVHSFKLIVPSLLGATKEGDKNDPKYPLSGVRDFQAWNPQDNESGIKKRIQDGMDDVSLAVTESINVSCVSHPNASKLAIEMLYQTQVFINELCSWVDSFYLELIKTSQVPTAEAWLLVASCIRKFCEVLRKCRAPADRAASKMDGATRTTAYLWAMIQVHREMKIIRSHNFRGHPSVAPVITLHVFKTRVTNSAFEKLSESVKSLDKKVGDNQKNFDKVQDRLSKVEKKS